MHHWALLPKISAREIFLHKHTETSLEESSLGMLIVMFPIGAFLHVHGDQDSTKLLLILVGSLSTGPQEASLLLIFHISIVVEDIKMRASTCWSNYQNFWLGTMH